MSRTSRCYAGTFFQFGGPYALLGAVRYPYQIRFAESLFSNKPVIAGKFSASREPKCGVACEPVTKFFAAATRRTKFFCGPERRGNLTATIAVMIG